MAIRRQKWGIYFAILKSQGSIELLAILYVGTTRSGKKRRLQRPHENRTRRHFHRSTATSLHCSRLFTLHSPLSALRSFLFLYVLCSSLFAPCSLLLTSLWLLFYMKSDRARRGDRQNQINLRDVSHQQQWQSDGLCNKVTEYANVIYWTKQVNMQFQARFYYIPYPMDFVPGHSADSQFQATCPFVWWWILDDCTLTIEVDGYTYTTNRNGIFAAGNAVSGSASIIKAIASGRNMASSIDSYLGGSGIIDEESTPMWNVLDAIRTMTRYL